MARRVPKKSMLTLDQIGQIRQKQARQIPMIFRRLRESILEEGYYAPEQVFMADGTPAKDEYGNNVFKRREMSPQQVKAAQITINAVLPNQQTTVIQDITAPVMTREDIEAMYRDALKRLTAKDIRTVLFALPDSEREKIIAGIAEPQERLEKLPIEGEVDG